MKAIRISAPVGIDGLVYEDAPDPRPAIGDVLVKVHACGSTASELYWPIYTDQAGRDRAPIIPGHEFSGVVVGLGYGTAGVAVGDCRSSQHPAAQMRKCGDGGGRWLTWVVPVDGRG